MAPLLALVIVTLLARGLGALGVEYVATWPDAVAVGMAAMFALTASAHWTQPRRDGLIAIVPPALPRPDLLVTATGVLEIAGAVGLLIPATRTVAAVCLGFLLLAMFPANVRAARGVGDPAAPRTPLLPRTAMQVLFISSAVVVAAS
ncbi:DoxX family protein [Pseudactinotalea terrae]|uniref:DoxX family protein n=1 Tax=Pseudactinotalea terrae TaxID=1743262 RepID=UPI0012E24280|nr:DoxX family protein [Pseudactinotalea terrae]